MQPSQTVSPAPPRPFHERIEELHTANVEEIQARINFWNSLTGLADSVSDFIHSTILQANEKPKGFKH